mmetsp:Transcript_14366/g.27140  ORF Transcript_14366/g.27140 Transcript_14366/m.27140 type:complete len:205 (-) Transcript_14366:567-1181(-)
MSASRNCRCWLAARGRPNWWRSLMYARAWSKQAAAPPTLVVPMEMRPPSRPRMAILNPSPSAPSRFSSGTNASSSTTVVVGWLRQPSFRSLAPKLRPSVPRSTRKAVTPSGPPPAGPVRAITIYKSVAPPPLMNTFSPFSLYPPPPGQRSARVRREPASEPALASVRQYDPRASIVQSFGRKRLFCSSVPNVPIIHPTMLWMVR